MAWYHEEMKARGMSIVGDSSVALSDKVKTEINKTCKVWWHRPVMWVATLSPIAYLIVDRVLHFFGVCIGF
jgi:hypothetical protein